MEALTIRLFGAPELLVADQRRPLRPRRTALLLFLLCQRAGSAVERGFLAGTLWPESDDTTGATNLRRLLADLRLCLGTTATCLTTPTRHTIRLELAPDRCDLLRFLALSARWERTGEGALADDALALYRGPLLEGFTDDTVLLERQRCQELALTMLEARGRAALEAGQNRRALARAQQGLALDPLREPLLRLALEALARSGDLPTAHRTYRDFCQRLQTELGGAPTPETRALIERLTPAARYYLPSFLTPFLGREAAVAHTVQQLTGAGLRLLTLIGPGGIGKTRLAVAAATQVAERFPDGVAFVDLAPLPPHASSDTLLGALAQALALPPPRERSLADQLDRFLAPRRVLLVADNAEHVVPELTSVIAARLAAAPELVVVATSRLPLGLPGEVLFPVAPLRLPATAALPALQGSEAVQLFLQRAQAVQPHFALTGENAAVIATLIARLDGLPLALELAAARLRAFTLAELASGLQPLLPVLTQGAVTAPERQRTLHATLAWSEALLAPDEARLLAQLSVFADGWTREAARQIGATETDQALLALVDHSLVVAEPGPDHTRYRLLETVREYAAARLEQHGERASTEQQLVDWACGWAQQLDDGIWGADAAQWMARFATERENLRAARQCADPAAALTLVHRLYQCWWRRGEYAEALAAIEEVLARSATAPETWERLLMRGAAEVLKWLMGQPHQRETVLDEQIAWAQRAGNRGGEIIYQLEKAVFRREAGDPDGALAAATAAVALARTIDSDWLLPYALREAGEIQMEVGELAVADQWLAEALPLWHPERQATHLPITLLVVGELRLKQARRSEAATVLRDALARFQQQGVRDLQVRALYRLAQAEQDATHALRAAALADELEDQPGATLARQIAATL